MEQTPSERRENKKTDVLKSLQKRRELMELGMPNDEAKQSLTSIIQRAGPVGFDRTDIMQMDKQIVKQLQDVRREAALNANPLLETRQVRAEGGDIDSQMEMMLGAKQETPMEMPMLPDEEMEEDYVDYVVEETLSNEDRNYLIGALEQDDRLSVIFDQVIETAHEFSGSGPIKGPGSGVSDSIPARLSDGEFVFTTKATEEIGVDSLMSMMKDAEAAVDERQMAYAGGPIKEEKEVMAAPKAPRQQNINVTKTTLDNGAAMSRQQEDLVGKAVKENMMLDPYQRHVRS
ncbi:hypothetical protein PQZ52_01350 [Flavobacteriales bacterium]|nr:hypothetical protein [Flavobacteriales bacterium]